jgi:glyoxylate/hydroxypyruvate reductase A
VTNLKGFEKHNNGPKYMVTLSPDFKMDVGWVHNVEKKLNVRIVEPNEVPDTQIEIALVDDSTNKALHSYKNLKAIFSLSAGIENLLEEQHLLSVPILRLITKDMVALMEEYVCYFALKLHRNFFDVENNQKRKVWEWFPPQSGTYTCNVTVLGLGQIGLPVAMALSRLGFNTTGWSRSEKKVDEIKTTYGTEGLDKVLPNTNILINLLPSTPETKGLLNCSLFKKLPSGANIVNVGRGDCLVESDLIEALNSGHLNRAVLDVFQHEPLPKNSALWKHSKITITPHMAAYPEPSTFYNAIESAIINAFYYGHLPVNVGRNPNNH